MNGEDVEMNAEGATNAPAEKADAGVQTDVGTANPEFAVEVDPVTGGRRVVQFLHDADAFPETEQPAEEKPAEDEQASASPPAYTSDELLQAMTLGQVDENRIPDALRANYVALRQQQQIAAMQAQQQAMRQAQPPPEAQPPQTDMTAMYRRMREVAEAKARSDLGMSESDVDGVEYAEDDESQKKAEAYRIAVEMNLHQLARAVEEHQRQALVQQQERQQAMAEIIPLYQQLAATEPHFAEIDQMMIGHYQRLAYADAVKVEAAMRRLAQGVPTRDDVPVLKEYYDKTRKAFYARRQGVPTTPQAVTPPARAQPPRVEGAGMVSAPQDKEVDWRAMRGMDARQRNAFIMANLH